MSTSPTILLLFYLMPSLFGAHGLAYYLPATAPAERPSPPEPGHAPSEPTGTHAGIPRRILLSERLDSGALLRDMLASGPMRDE